MLRLGRRMLSKRRILVLTLAGIVTLLLFYNAPRSHHHLQNRGEDGASESLVKEEEEEEDEMRRMQATPKCEVIRQFNDITDSGYFIFVKPRYADAAAVSNLFFYLGLKYKQYFAINVDKPMNWFGLNHGFVDSTYLQKTEEEPKVISQELSFDLSGISKILPGFRSSKNVVIGFLRDPIQVFLSCLQGKVQYQRRSNQEGTSIMMDKNVNNYLDTFEGNPKASTTYISHSSCNNQLSFSLGLDDISYRSAYQTSGAAERFAEEVEERVTQFIVYERVVESLYMFYVRQCWEPADDLLFFNQVPEIYVGIGFGNMTPKTRLRLEEFLKFDLAVYKRVLRRFDLQFRLDSRNSWFASGYLYFKKQYTDFHSSCCQDTLSVQIEESKGRKYGLTDSGARDIQCRLIHASNKVLSSIVYQIQETNLTSRVSQMIRNNEPYSHFIELIEKSLEEPGDT